MKGRYALMADRDLHIARVVVGKLERRLAEARDRVQVLMLHQRLARVR